MPTATKKAAAAKSKDPAPITPGTMRHLHGALRMHGFTGDEEVHDYLSVALGREVESRKTLTEDEAQAVIEELAAAPRTPTPEALVALRRPFPEEAIGKLPRSLCSECSKNRGSCDRHPNKGECRICGNYHNTAATMHLDYVGHADVTARLLEVDPLWTWEPANNGPDGKPSVMHSTDKEGNLWINLTVGGVTRPGVGDGKNAKERIGDALRNAAMRFGVALDLWAKGDREWAHAEKTGDNLHPDDAGPREQVAPPPYHGPSSPLLVDRLVELAESQNTDLEAITAKFRGQHGGIGVEQLDTVPAPLLHGLVQSIEAYIAKQAHTEGAPA